MAKYKFLLCYLSCVALCLPTSEERSEANQVQEDDEEVKSCHQVFSDHGMNYSSFYKGVSHGLHSLSLEEIRYFFKADAPEDNLIPTVNTDFRAENPVLYSAPLWGYNERFSSWALKIMDFFMLNDKPYFYETMSNTLEKLSHQYHMQEIYLRAAVLYKEMLEDSSLDDEFCSCANDIVLTGVLAELAAISKTFKYRARTGRKLGQCHGDGGGTYNSGSIYNNNGGSGSGCRGKRSVETEEEIVRLKEEYLNNTNQDTASALLRSGGWKPNTVTGPKEWVTYSAMLYTSLPTQEEIKDFATFLYCKLNQPQAFPTDLF